MMMENIDKELEFFKEWDKKALRNDDFGNVYSVDINSAISMAKNRVREVILKLTHSKTSKEEIRFSLLRMGTLFLDIKIGQKKKLDDFYVLFENGILKKEHYLLYQNGIRVLEAVIYVLSIIYMRNRSFLERIDIPSLKYFDCSYKEITEECLSKWEDRFENGIIALQKQRSGEEVELKDVPSFIQELEIEMFKFGEAFSLKECHSRLYSLRTNMQYSSLANVLLATLLKVYALPKENSIQEEFYKCLVKRIECIFFELLNAINTRQTDVESSIRNVLGFLLDINIDKENLFSFLKDRIVQKVSVIEHAEQKINFLREEFEAYNTFLLCDDYVEYDINKIKYCQGNGIQEYLEFLKDIREKFIVRGKITWHGSLEEFATHFFTLISRGCFRINGEIVYEPIYKKLYKVFCIYNDLGEVTLTEFMRIFKAINLQKSELVSSPSNHLEFDDKLKWTLTPQEFVQIFCPFIAENRLSINGKNSMRAIVDIISNSIYIPRKDKEGELKPLGLLGLFKKENSGTPY